MVCLVDVYGVILGVVFRVLVEVMLMICVVFD